MRTFIILLTSIFLAACYSAPPNYGPPPGFPPPQHTPIQGQMCGGMMGAQCANPNDYCYMPSSARCGAADASGVCRPRPQMCTKEYAPVCGCDGRTYSNACTAAGNGASVAHHGQCQR